MVLLSLVPIACYYTFVKLKILRITLVANVSTMIACIVVTYLGFPGWTLNDVMLLSSIYANIFMFVLDAFLVWHFAVKHNKMIDQLQNS